MKILLVSTTAPPMNSPESIQTGRYIKHLSRKHEVTLLTSAVSNGWEPSDDKVNAYLSHVHKIIRLSALNSKIARVLKKILPRIFFPDDSAPFVWQKKRAIGKLEKPELIFSRAAPFSSSVLAYELAQHFNVPWIMHLSDPWADSPFSTASNNWKARLTKLEEKCIARAQYVTLTSQQTIEFYKRKYPNWASKFKFLPNVFDEQELNPETVDFSGKVRFVFTGRLYGNRSVNDWMNAIEEAIKLNPSLEETTEFIFAGFFIDESVNRIRQSKSATIMYKGPLSLEDAVALQRSATILVAIDVLEETDPRYNLFFPSKLLDYFAARRKIIALTGANSTTHEVVHEKYGWAFNGETIRQLPAFISEIAARFRNKDKGFFVSTESFEQFASSHNAEKLEALLKEALYDAS